ncbi:hypothetical protein BDZ89DRAFT_1229878 [Hymenopellis radicata]|nr:hypothetical protein BDZ89DRAFT_1229878 [Hymenopellis radicata]
MYIDVYKKAQIFFVDLYDSRRTRCLADHAALENSSQTSPSFDFRLRPDSDPNFREYALIHFARALASKIVDYANAHLSMVPTPDASAREWKLLAGVSKNALFPLELLDDMKQLENDVHRRRYAESKFWEDISDASVDAAAIVVCALTKPSNPYLYLPSLLYLAKHARVPIFNLRSIYTMSKYSYFLAAPSDLVWRPTGNGDPGLDPYAIEWTLNFYLFLNIVLSLDSEEAFDAAGRELPYRGKVQTQIQANASWYRDEYLHREFWCGSDDVGGQLKDAQARSAYSHRCFCVLVSWYAIMSEAASRNKAVRQGSIQRVQSMLYLDQDDLTRMILVELDRISEVFRLPGLDPAPFSTYPRALRSIQSLISVPPSPHLISQLDTQHHVPRYSALLCLPTEMQTHIYSFLPLKSLLSISLACKWVYEICVELIYRDPLHTAIHLQHAAHSRITGSFLYRQSRLSSLLDRRPDLARRVRGFQILLEANGDSNTSEGPLSWASAKDFTDLWLCIRDSIFGEFIPSFYPVAQDIARLCPNLSSLQIGSFSRTLVLDVRKDPAIAILPTTLKRFTLRASHPVQQPHAKFYLQMIQSSSTSLCYLNLDISVGDFDIRSFPVCENVKQLLLRLPTPALELQQLLKTSFPAVEVLYLDDLSPVEYLPGINFCIAAPFLRHLCVSWFHIRALSSTLEILCLQRMYGAPGVSFPRVTPSVQAILIDGNVDDMEYATLKDLGPSFPSLRSLQLHTIWPPISESDLPHIASIVETSFPLLETLIILVNSLSNRPRRMDYPVCDGLDQVQEHWASHFFGRCPNLQVISFNGIPSVDGVPDGRYPARVWVRDSSTGARMATSGRAMLKWKLSEFWNNGTY